MSSIRQQIKSVIVISLCIGFVFSNAQKSHAITTVATSTEQFATREPDHRKTWYDGSRYWVSFDNGSDIVFYYSTDGSSWTQNTSATISNEDYQFSVYGDDTYAYLVIDEGLDSDVMEATSYPGTSFSWSSQSTALNGTGGTNSYISPTITRDADGIIWVGALHYDGSDIDVSVTSSTSADDISSFNSPSILDTNIGSAGNSSPFVIVPLDNGDVYAVWWDNDNLDVEGCIYDSQTSSQWEDSGGTACDDSNFDTIDADVEGGSNGNLSASVDTTNYDIHLSFKENQASGRDHRYIRWDNGSSAWQSSVELSTTDEGTGHFSSISVDTATDDVYFMFIPGGTDIYYMYCDTSEASSECDAIGDWSSETDIGDLGALFHPNINSNLRNNERIFAIWKDGSSSPYDIEFHSFLEPSGLDPEDHTMTFSLSSVAADDVNNEITTSEASTFNSLPFGHLTFDTPKYVAHELSVTTNATHGYSVTAKLLNTLQGNYPANLIDPFVASWGSPTTWTQPTGTTANVQTAWFGANTTDTDVSGWNSSPEQKFGGIGTTSVNVMQSDSADEAGSTITVTYVIEANQFHPPDLYAGTLVYNLTPTY